MRYFDLNIEKILEGWEPRHAIRELIANAMDEQALSGTTEIEVLPQGPGHWHIRDFGRGLRYDHLTQNENAEKLAQSGKVIGKFGVGLKDALATLNRHGIKIQVRSRYGDISIISAPKHGFQDVVTLHATIEEAEDPSFVGTDIRLIGVPDEEVRAAQTFFLRFMGDKTVAETAYGQILQRSVGSKARVYVTGLLVAEEEGFAFSYNITSLTAAMKRALNRERTWVARRTQIA
jgi:histidine kinase/DNA gyrase B/HSP90-like ATPase